MRGWSVFTRPPSISGESVSASTRSTGRPSRLEVRRGAAARDELPAELGEAAREVVEAGLVVGGDQRAHSSLTTSGSSRCSTALIRSCSVSAVSPAQDGTRSCASTGPVSTPSSTRWTVAPVSATPAASASSTACAPGKSGSSDGWTLTTAPGKRSRNGRREEVHVAGEDDELDALRLRASRPCATSRSARSGSRRARRPRSGRRVRARRARARPRRFDATATTGSPASSSAWRFVPVAADEDADHAIRPITSSPGSALRHDGAAADAEVEDAAQLVLLDVARRASGRPAAAPTRPSRSRRCRPSGRTRSRLPSDAAAGDVRERAAPGRAARRATSR